MSTGIIHINKTENGEFAVSVEYKSEGVWQRYDAEHDVKVVLNRYYNARRIKKYVKCVINRKMFFNPYLGTQNIGPIKSRPTNSGGEGTYYNRIIVA